MQFTQDVIHQLALELETADSFLGGPEHLFNEAGDTTLDLILSKDIKNNARTLDIGCGCLRIGIKLINYLQPDCYYGIEPNKTMLNIGIKHLLAQLIGQICILVSVFMLFKQIRKKQIHHGKCEDLSKQYTKSNLDGVSINSTINPQSVGSKKRKTLLSCIKYFLLTIFIAPIVIPIMYSMGWLFLEAFSTLRYFIDLSF